MFKRIFKITFPIMIAAAFLISACGASIETISPTQDVNAIYTAAAQTIEAKTVAVPTYSPAPTDTLAPSITPSPTLTPTETPVPPTSPLDNYCDNSAFVADVTVPDGTVFAPGQSFDKTWTFQNTGLCTWKPGYTIVFVKGDMMGGNTRPINQTVPPKVQVNVTVRLVAPNTPGKYTGYWRIANSKGELIGDTVSVVIIVAPGGVLNETPTESAGSSTPQAEAPTGTATPGS